MQTIKKRGSGVKKQQEQEIVTLAHKVSAFMARYRNQFMIAGVLIAVAIALFAGYSLVRSVQEQNAAPLVAAAYEYYSPSGTMTADYKKALELFRDIQKKYPGTTSGAIAQYYIGNCLANLGQTDEALKAYETFIKNYSGDKYLLGFVYQRMGYAYSSLGKKDDALKAFERSETLTGPGAATIELARLYESAGKIRESQDKYKVVLEKLGGTSWSMEAMGKVQSIRTTPQTGETKTTK